MNPLLDVVRLMLARLSHGARRSHGGSLKPVVDRTFAFDDVPAALALMQAGCHFGKVVVKY